MKKLDFYWIENSFTFIDKKRMPQSIEKKSEFYFINNSEGIENQNKSYLVIIEGTITSKEELLNNYYLQFKFPYFGFNWDALLDCLKDLYWIEQKKVIIYHSELPQLNENDLKIYLEILRDLVAHWKKYDDHNLEVYFDLKDYEAVLCITQV